VGRDLRETRVPRGLDLARGAAQPALQIRVGRRAAAEQRPVDQLDDRLVAERRVRLPSRGSGIAWGNNAVWVSAYDSELVVQLDARTGALLGAVHTEAQPRESLVVGNTLWVVNRADGTVTPISIGS
jgi:hypothetical protein